VLVVNPCWKRVCEGLVDKAEVCIAAITVPAGEGWRDAQILRATATESATAVGAAEPSDANPIANRKPACAVADGIDYADNLMTWGDFGMFGGQVALGQVQIGTADTAAVRFLFVPVGPRPKRPSRHSDESAVAIGTVGAPISRQVPRSGRCFS
jgi:hypothetical protein